MARRPRDPNKKPGFFRQITTLYNFTRAEYPWLPWVLIGILLACIGLGVVLGLVFPASSVWSAVMWGFMGLATGLMIAMFTLTRLSTSAMYKKIDGMPGAAGHVLSTSLPRSWSASDTPVGVNPRTQEAVYRAVGRAGIVIVGEGSRGRLTRLVNEERSKAQRVAHGVPVTVFYLGHGQDEVPIKMLTTRIKALPSKIDKATMAAVIKRLESVSQTSASLPIPKGIDPLKVRASRPR
ncbi:MAG: DUF4191 domain-containing protein [Microbacterium sp.]|uniref:DUF4191 domain-containing protein n=1 Tax=Microbacterium sp. TaxID=51671 RepID=UPI0039E425F8